MLNRRRKVGKGGKGWEQRLILHAWMEWILPIARCPSICFISIVRTCCSGHDEQGCSVSTVTTLWDGIAGNRGLITYWSRDLSLCFFCLEYPVRLPTGAENFVYTSPAWSTLFDYLLKQRYLSTSLPPGVPCSITYWSRDFCLRLSRLEYPVRLPTEAEIFVYVSPAWSRDICLRLSRLEYPVRLPTEAEIFVYVSPAWSTLFDYLLEQRFISMPFLPGVPCSITYCSRDLSLCLFSLEYPVRLPTGAEIYLYASSAWSTLFVYLLEQRFISMLFLPGVPCSITYWSRDLSLCLFSPEYPVRLPTGAGIYLYASSAWSTLFDYLLEQRGIPMPLLPGIPCSITYWSRDVSLRLSLLEYPLQLPTGTEIYLFAPSA